MNTVITIVEALASLAALLGGTLVWIAMSGSMSAPQQGAMAAVGIGVAAIPYMFAGLLHRNYVRSRLSPHGEAEDSTLNLGGFETSRGDK